MRVIFTKFGPWNSISMALNNLPILIRSSAIWGMRKAAEKLKDIVIGHIDNQDLAWASVSSKTISGDPRILVDTEQYRNSIETFIRGNTYYVGVPSNKYNSRGIRISDLAWWHEEGRRSQGLPPRPLI